MDPALGCSLLSFLAVVGSWHIDRRVKFYMALLLLLEFGVMGVFAAADEGEPVGRIATMLRVSVSYVSKALSRRRLTGQTQARPQRCDVVPKLSGLPAISGPTFWPPL